MQNKLVLQINRIIFCAILIKSCSSEISTSNNQFSLQLYSALTAKHDGDFSISPFPVTKLFAALYAEAGGNDLIKAIRNSPQFPEDISTVAIESLENIQSAFLVNDSIVQNFKNILKNDLDVTILSTNLSDLDATQNTIVNWTDHRTNESAQFLKEHFNENATTFLLSKSFFEATWVHKFHSSFTKPSPFYYDETHANQVDMMFQRARVPYAEIPELDCTAVSLPYNSETYPQNSSADDEDFHRLEMIILLPNSRTGLTGLETSLKTYPFSRIPQQFLNTKDMFLYIPKFNVSSMVDLSEVVSKLGTDSQTSSEGINLSNVTFNGDKNSTVNISKILHFVKFSVDENGSNASNETSATVPNYSLKYNSPESFRANRPFIGFLYDQEKHIILNIFRKKS
ncbi:antichymotrypsin-2 isoform X2 [Folsomia candida]|uniref:antichymotrypsin-2 isoform X2 n=1 Tax=Folsomia candida TaxID=158441 RepID=UPI0016055139|nr:antichymotrypsin-2 isoform X2 [Folsomia candida]